MRVRNGRMIIDAPASSKISYDDTALRQAPIMIKKPFKWRRSLLPSWRKKDGEIMN